MATEWLLNQAAGGYISYDPDDRVYYLTPEQEALLAEPLGGDEVEDNFTPAGRLMSGASVLCCTPHGMVDDGSALGAVVADSRLRDIMLGAGFSSFERVMTTRYSRVLFGRP